MLTALASGTLIREPKHGTSASGTRWANSTIRVPCGTNRDGEAETAFLSVIAFGDVADRLARLGQGDAVSVQGPMRQTEYQAKDGSTRSGLEIVANSLLSPYQINKKRGDQGKPAPRGAKRTSAEGFDDPISF